MTAYYNELDPFAVEWLRRLIAAGLIPPGEVDERDIREVRPTDLRGFHQCHFFAGIGGWAYALALAGWDEPCWTGSCPCQPFSGAGKQNGAADERHLWPEWFRLIRECRPDAIFGEQVAGAIGLGWLDAVSLDLEAEGYAVGSAVLPAAGVGAPHGRHRLYFVADANGREHTRRPAGCDEADRRRSHGQPSGSGSTCGVADSLDGRAGGRSKAQPRGDEPQDGVSREDGRTGGMADADSERRQQDAGGAPRYEAADGREGRDAREPDGDHEPASDGAIRNPWSPCDWLPCRDGKARPVEPGTFPLAHGVPGRVGRLRAYGNAIVPQVAAAFVSAYRGVL